MALRKEQTLVLASVALGLLAWRSGREEPLRPLTLAPGKIEYTAAQVPSTPLLTTAPATPVLRAWFVEPSETQPLPPRVLLFPALPPLFVIALPLEPGPDYAFLEQLTLPGTPAADVALEAAAEGAPAPAEPAPAPQQTRADKKQRWARVYDRVSLVNQQEELFGVVSATDLATGKELDRFDLERRTDFDGVLVHLHQFSIDKEQFIGTSTFGKDERVKIQKIQLANTLRNEVQRRIRRVPDDPAYFVERTQTIDWLLLQAREESWVYEVALAQAELLVARGAGLDGLRTKARVLRAKGDLAGEFALYRAVEGGGPAAAFRHEGLGLLSARLGLFADAEQDLRAAVAAAPTDARPLASLAGFLCQRGQARAAADVARQALARFGSVTDDADRARVIGSVVEAELAVGGIPAARAALQAQGPVTTPAGIYLRACIDYAAGALPAARDGFRQASADGADNAAALLGLAATQLRLGEWQDALSGFESVLDQAPLLRHQAAAGLALLHFRIGRYDAALNWVERALEACPDYVYALYLKGRALAEQGLLAPAQEALEQTLRLRDDFVPAIAELAAVHARAARELGAAEHAWKAMRYSGRAIELMATPIPVLYERLGRARYYAGDLRAASQAFAQARDGAADDDQRHYAQAGQSVVDYAQERTEEALGQLDRLIRDLPREHPIRAWAEETRKLIDDHAQKEMLGDRFERDVPGNVWEANRDGSLGPAIDAGRLVFKGSFTRAGTEVSARRLGALPRAGRFLAVAATIQLGAAHETQGTFAGLRIQTQRGAAGAPDFTARLGFLDGKPHLELLDGREDPIRKALTVADGNPLAVHRLGFRVEPRDEQGNQFRLLCTWDDEVVERLDLKQLRGNSPNELETLLVVEGQSRGASVDVAFDDYHLERRKDG